MSFKDRHPYYRLLKLDYQLFEHILKLPDGFEVDAIQESPEDRALMLRIRCPKDERYIVKEGQSIPQVIPLCTVWSSECCGFSRSRIHWPDLGQEDPVF